MTALPSAFEALEPLVEKWALATSDERVRVRGQSSFDEIKAFYNAMVPHAENALRHLNGKDIRNLTKADEELMRLMLALAHTAIAVEVQKMAHIPGVSYPHELRIVSGPTPFG